MKPKILLATGQREIDEAVKRFDTVEVVGTIEYKQYVLETIKETSPEILIIGEGLTGQESTVQVILNLVKDFPRLRIIYLSGHVDIRDDARVSSLGILVMAGVYDIIHDQKLNSNTLKNIIQHPRTYEQVSYLAKKAEKYGGTKTHHVDFEIPEEETQDDSDTHSNLFVISSIKPGTGKSFLSTNIAAAIAAYGQDIDGRKPRVAIVEADLQNLSVGTLLQIEDDKKNLKTVIEKISTVVSDNGKMTGDLEAAENVNEYIRSCFKPYYRVKNLEALVGSQLSFSELEIVKPFHYVYLIESILDEFDVIIVDTNSSLTHVTTFPLLHMAKNCFYVLNLDFNNVRNNVRYQEMLQEIGIMDKVKYVLNEDVTQDEQYKSSENHEELIFTADHLDDSSFKLESRIPSIPQSIFLNRLYEGTPIVLDDKSYTSNVRYELLKAANQIYPIKNFEEIEKKALKQRNKKKKGIFS